MKASRCNRLTNQWVRPFCVDSSPKRLAFIGCGGIAQTHLHAVRTVNQKSKAPKLSIVAAVDTRVEVAENLFRDSPATRIFQSFEKCLSEVEFDVAVILLPHHLHESFTLKSLDCGKHVFLEKPFANSSPECLRMISHANKSKNLLFVNEQSELWPEVLKAQSLLPRIGKFVTAKAIYHESFDITNPFPEQYSKSAWRNDLKIAGGGIMMDGGLHWIRGLRRLCGEVESVVHLQRCALDTMQGESLGHSILEFDSGKVATLDCIVGPPMGRHPFFTIIGTEGEIQIAGEFDGGITFRDKEDNLTDMGSQGGYFGAFAPHWEYFLDCLEANDTSANLQSAMQDIKVVEAMYRSHRNKKWENVETLSHGN